MKKNSKSIIMEKRNIIIAKRIVEIMFFLHHLLSYMEHYDVEFNHHYTLTNIMNVLVESTPVDTIEAKSVSDPFFVGSRWQLRIR